MDIESDGKVLCHFDLSDAEGHCSLDNKQLKAGSYEIEAHYNGDDALSPSTSEQEAPRRDEGRLEGGSVAV